MTKEEFKEARKKLKLTQSEFGVELGISSRTVQGYEYGKQKVPLAIASFIKQKISELSPIIKRQTIEMNVENLNTLSIEEMVSFCLKHRDYFEQIPEIKLLIERHRKDAEGNLMERHIFLKNYQVNSEDEE